MEKYMRLKIIMVNILTPEQFTEMEEMMEDNYTPDKDKYIINEILSEKEEFDFVREEGIRSDYEPDRDLDEF